MSQAPRPSLDELFPEIAEFVRSFASLLLATADANGQPHASYAVHRMDGAGNLYVYISQLAAHTVNLQARPQASVLFIEDENRAQQIFARKRLSGDCRAEPIPRNGEDWVRVLDAFVTKHGAFMEMLKSLADFQLFRLVPEKASYVRGFGQAYDLSGEQFAAALAADP